MLCKEIIAVCSEIHTKHINTVCGPPPPFPMHRPATSELSLTHNGVTKVALTDVNKISSHSGEKYELCVPDNTNCMQEEKIVTQN